MGLPASAPGWVMLLQTLLSLCPGGILFLGLWASLNFGFGMALDGPIGAFVMEQPCQRLASTAERLSGYTLGKGSKGSRSTPAVCHFGTRTVIVSGPMDTLGFRKREFLLIVTSLAGYAVCFAGAGVGSYYVVLQACRLLGYLSRWWRPGTVTPPPVPRRRKRR